MPRVFITEAVADLRQHLHDALTFVQGQQHISSNTRVFLKPNLTYPMPKLGVTTTPEFMAAIIDVFAQYSSHLIVGESDGGYQGWPAELSFKSHGLPDLCRRYGARLVNLSKEPRTAVPLSLSRGDVTLHLPSLLLDEIDLFVTLPVPKVHQVTVMSGAIKNQWGCIPDNMRLLFHPYFDEMVLEVNRLVKVRFAFADGSYFLNRGGPMFGDPIRMGLVLASDSIGALDAAICEIMGIDISRVRYLDWARQRGWIPAREQINYSLLPEKFRKQRFDLQLTLRNRVVRWAFDRPWAITLFWDSWFADLFHKLLYTMTGNPVRDEIRSLHNQ